MTAGEAVKLRIIAVYGWDVKVVLREDGRHFYQAVDNGDIKNQITGFSIDALFSLWSEEPSVAWDLLRVKIIRT